MMQTPSKSKKHLTIVIKLGGLGLLSRLGDPLLMIRRHFLNRVREWP